MAKEVDVLDGPNDQGEMFERPAKPEVGKNTSASTCITVKRAKNVVEQEIV